MKRKITKAELEEENKWLWYNQIDVEDDAVFVEINQYNKKGEIIACSSEMMPPKEYRVPVPKHLSKNKMSIKE